MIRIITENTFVDNVKLGDSFHPTKFAFMCVYEGEVSVVVNKISYQCSMGKILLISPNNLYRIESCTKELKMVILSFEREMLRDKISFKINRYDAYQIAQMENKHVVEIEALEFDQLKELFLLACYYVKNGDKRKFGSEILTSIMTSVIYLVTGFLLVERTESQLRNYRKEEITVMFFELVSKHFKEQKALSFYAQNLSISIKYLSNCVREITKSPPTSYISDALMNEAKIMLLDPQNTVRMIGDELGFADQYTFGKFFKKHAGFSPKNYRKQNHLIDMIL